VRRKKIEAFMGLSKAAFGSAANRFNTSRINALPGPGAYAPPSNTMAIKGKLDGRGGLRSRIQQLTEKGPIMHAIGESNISSANLNVPVFGSQSYRFADRIEGIIKLTRPTLARGI
jgi:hypothetical protein